MWHPAGFSTWPRASLFAQDSKAGTADRVQGQPINSIKGRYDDKRDIRTQKHGSATKQPLPSTERFLGGSHLIPLCLPKNLFYTQ